MTPLERELKRVLDTLDDFEAWRRTLPPAEAQAVRDAYVKARETMPIDEATAHVRATWRP